MSRYLNSVILVLTAALVAGYEAGLLTAANAFFGAVAVGTVMLALQFRRYEGAPLGQAAREILGGPAGHDEDAFGYLSCMGVLVLSAVLAAQVVLGY